MSQVTHAGGRRLGVVSNFPGTLEAPLYNRMSSLRCLGMEVVDGGSEVRVDIMSRPNARLCCLEPIGLGSPTPNFCPIP